MRCSIRPCGPMRVVSTKAHTGFLRNYATEVVTIQSRTIVREGVTVIGYGKNKPITKI